MMSEVDRAGPLAEAVGKGALWPATGDDVVGGVPARWVARPTDTAELSALLRAASRQGLAVVARGGGTRLSWGPPPERVDVLIDTTGLTGIVEHVAGDLVVVVRAGTLLRDLEQVLASSGQRLAIDGEHPGATVGGLVAHAVSGPSRLLYGTLRDLLIGVTFVRGDGVVARSGGKVVKNVAGYDLGKLLHGSWGTLGVITEVVFRLHPLPPASRWITTTAGDLRTVGVLTQRVLQAQLVPSALEIDRPPGAPTTVTVLVEGPVATIDHRAAQVAATLSVPAVDDRPAGPPNGSPAGHDGSLGRSTPSATPPPWWGRRPAGPGEVLLRLTTEIAALPDLLSALQAASSATGLPVHVRGSAGVGSLLAGVALDPGGEPGAGVHARLGQLVDRLRQHSGRWGGTVVVLDGPVAALGPVDRWGPVAGLDLMRRVKERFDPGRVLAPGRFVGGI